jgi:hypothetical protein
MKASHLYESVPLIFSLFVETIIRTRCVQWETRRCFKKDVHNGRFRKGLQLISEQYQTHRFVGLKSHMDTNWIYISRNRADYRLLLRVRLHVTLSFGGPRKSRLYLKSIFQTHFVCMFYMHCQQVELVNLFLRWIQKHFKPALCRGMLN